MIEEECLLWSPLVRPSYGVSPERRRKKTSEGKDKGKYNHFKYYKNERKKKERNFQVFHFTN